MLSYVKKSTDWHSMVPDNAAAKKALNKGLLQMSHQCVQQADLLKNDLNTQGINSSIFDDILEVINKRAHRIISQLAKM